MARLFVDNLTVIDFSYLDSKRGVVGESWIVDIELIGDLDDQGMVFDFGKIKKQIKQIIDQEVDHRLLVPKATPGCSTDHKNSELHVEFPLLTGGLISHQSPPGAVLLVDAASIDADGIARDLQTGIKALLPDNVSDVRINLRSEAIDGAYYHYTHGLQKHLGQCQRIAHGHRSRIEIEVDGERCSRLETQWAGRLMDSYIATESHIVGEFEINGIAHTRLAYTAEQGDFFMSLPTSQLFRMSSESTVENIATCLAEHIAQENTGRVFVKAFEGPDKGAFGEVADRQKNQDEQL